MSPHPATVRVRAPELAVSGSWFNTSTPLTLASLRGRFVVLDFWTFCCANCLHVIDELRPLEQEFADILTVVGVHSPKFAHEAEAGAVQAAVARYEVHHPVANDPALSLWRQYAVRAWPTLVLIDPEGYVVAQAAGEGQVGAFAAIICARTPDYAARGTLRPGGGPGPEAPAASAAPAALAFPAKAIVLPTSTGRDEQQATLLVADAGHHQLVELAADGECVIRRIGSGRRGRNDGPAASATFAEPNGLTLLPSAIAQAAGFDVVVADTANHLLRGVRLADGAVVTTIDLAVSLDGVRTITGAVPHALSPWDVVWWPAIDALVVAAAGAHLLLSVDPVTVAVKVLAGTTVEGLRDGTAADAWLAQPSGLAVDGDRLWFVDAETSALRHLSAAGQVHTVVGEGLFDFGHVDGSASVARLQHPLGVSLLSNGAVAVSDTYNGAIRVWDERTGELSTLATDLAEPSGALVVDGDLLVVESAAHRVVRVIARSASVHHDPMRTQRPTTAVRPGPLTVAVSFTPPPGRVVDDRYGAAVQLSISSSPDNLLVRGAGESKALTRVIEIDPSIGEGVLHISAHAASCDAGSSEHPACYLARQDWGVPVVVVPHGLAMLELTLLG